MLIKNKNLNLYLVLLFFIISFFINFNKVFAATINFFPFSSVHNVGDTISIKINVSSDKSINAVSGNITFPSDILSIISISKNSSIVDLWPQKPTLNNNSVYFEGVILNGYSGSAGNIITLVFKAKSAGMAYLKFSNVSILANNGKGTNVFSNNLSNGTVQIKKNMGDLPVIGKIEVSNDIKETPNNVVEKSTEARICSNISNNLLYILIIILIVLFLVLIFCVLLCMFKSKKSLNKQ